jgi:DNA gyrase subunit B
MAAKKPEYGNDSISSLKGADRVRLRPGVIFGSDGLDGTCHSVFEILSNSIDEAREGHGSEIIITKYKDGSIEVEDFGRGIPVDFNERENRYNWELVFCEMYAGGKYNNQTAESYEYSLGLNGLGLCATQYAAEYMEVAIFRDGTLYELSFREGENIGGLRKSPTTRRYTGSKIKWRPDLKVFTEIDIPAEYFHETIKKQAVVNQGIRFIFKNETENGFESFVYYYEKGIIDYVNEISQDKSMFPVQFWQCERQGRDRADKPEYKVKINVAFTFNNHTPRLEYYHNSSWLEHGGSPDKAVRSAFLWELDSYLKQNGKYNKGEGKITFADIADSLLLVTSSFSTQTSYENQTKKAINNKFIQDAMAEFLRAQLEIFFIENKTETEQIAEQVLINKRSRETAERARISVKKKLSGNLDMQNRVQKFVDCRSKDIDLREVYIVEGDSALGSCKLARDAEFQAIIPVRGKILNCLKADLDKIFKNDIITDLIKVLGCGVEVSHGKKSDLNTFDLSNLRWNKVIICTDADVDGFQIRTLILAMLYRLTPTLINEGKVFIAESPLFEIICKGKSYFAYTEKERKEIEAKLTGKFSINRSKGLGENDPEMMWLTTMNPKTRRLIQVLPEDARLTAEMFDILLGDNINGRKAFIAENGSNYLDLADIS